MHTIMFQEFGDYLDILLEFGCGAATPEPTTIKNIPKTMLQRDIPGQISFHSLFLDMQVSTPHLPKEGPSHIPRWLLLEELQC